MGSKIFVGALVVITALYCYALGWLAYGFARSGQPVGWGLAAGVAILLALTVWVTWREVLFGLAAARAGRQYAADLETGRIPAPREEARAEFEAARDALQDVGGDSTSGETAHDWRAWFRLGLAYDALKDRKNARASIRRALELRRESTRARD